MFNIISDKTRNSSCVTTCWRNSVDSRQFRQCKWRFGHLQCRFLIFGSENDVLAASNSDSPFSAVQMALLPPLPLMLPLLPPPTPPLPPTPPQPPLLLLLPPPHACEHANRALQPSPPTSVKCCFSCLAPPFDGGVMYYIRTQIC